MIDRGVSSIYGAAEFGKMKFVNLENIVIGIWVLNLFKPEWIIAHYVPGTDIFKVAPTLLLYPAFICLLFSNRKIHLDKPYLIYFLVTVLTSFLAYNTGISRLIVRGVFESLILYILTVSVLQQENNVERLIKLYLFSFTFYALWGIVGGGRVSFHINLKNEDAFGPFMAMGVPLAYFVAHRTGAINYREMGVFILCIIGIIASFARGAFISLCMGLAYIFIRYKRKVFALIIMVFVILMIIASASVMFKDSYWNEISTIFEAHEETVGVGDTGRQFLWMNAWRMFLMHPILGVGPRNYGFVILRVTTFDEIDRYAYNPSYV